MYAHVSLPTIVVAGNQSSGKSSLIEAISGVSVALDAQQGRESVADAIRSNFLELLAHVHECPLRSVSDKMRSTGAV